MLFGLKQAANAQGGEVGLAGGGSFYLDQTVTAEGGEAKAGFDPGFAVSGWIGHNMYKYLGGEIRYMFEQQGMKLNGPGGSASFSGRSHALHYNFLIHTAPNDAKVRPFVAVGGGIKGYQGTGTEVVAQPSQEFALLSKTNDWKGLIVFGGGVKFAVSDNVSFRVEVYDYFSQTPTKVIAPAPGASIGSWFHNFVPMVGVSIRF
ncbi:MAG: outer membrane beta-barrel protein [bacterium]|nr:outer membrane beta-barrel protein [bacterium]